MIVGSGTGSSREIHRVVKTAEEKGMKRIGPYSVTKTMANTTSAAISTFFGTKGVSFSIASACSTSLHCISHGFDLIKNGKQDIVIAGGAEDDHWPMIIFCTSSNHYVLLPIFNKIKAMRYAVKAS